MAGMFGENPPGTTQFTALSLALAFCDRRGVEFFSQSRGEAHHEQTQLDWVRDVDCGVPFSSLISRRNGAAPRNRHVESQVVFDEHGRGDRGCRILACRGLINGMVEYP